MDSFADIKYSLIGQCCFPSILLLEHTFVVPSHRARPSWYCHLTLHLQPPTLCQCILLRPTKTDLTHTMRSPTQRRHDSPWPLPRHPIIEHVLDLISEVILRPNITNPLLIHLTPPASFESHQASALTSVSTSHLPT